jgi:hypothetical protein
VLLEILAQYTVVAYRVAISFKIVHDFHVWLFQAALNKSLHDWIHLPVSKSSFFKIKFFGV